MLGNAALCELALCEDAVLANNLFVDPKYHDAQQGRGFGNDNARGFGNDQSGRGFGNANARRFRNDSNGRDHGNNQ